MAPTIELTSPEVRALCERYFEEEQTVAFQIKRYELKTPPGAPSGFLGRHQILNVDIIAKCRADVGDDPHSHDDKDDELQTLCFFMKSAPVDIASRMSYLEEFGVFKKEILVYRTVLPVLQRISAEFAPRCYYADNNSLVFEHLVEQGYRMAAPREGLFNYEHLNCALKALAAMHAASIVHEVREGRKINEMYPEAVMENAYPMAALQNRGEEDHVRLQNFNNANLVLREIVKELPKYTAHLDLILGQLRSTMLRVFDMAQVSAKYHNVFSHGDLWANNVMFQYGKFGEVPIQCRLVDFQLARYAPPMLDLITLLTIPTSRRFREKHLDELLANYYRYMSEFLKRESISISKVLPTKQFYESADEFRLFGLIESFLFSHLTILPPELTLHLTTSTDGFSEFFDKRVDLCMRAFHADEIYRERLTDMIEDILDNFVLNQ